MATPVALRYVEASWMTYRRTWRGTAITSFLNPVLYLAAMGLGLGTLVDGADSAAALGADSYLEFLAPGLLVATAMITGAVESSFPVMAGIKWLKTYQATLATPVGVSGLVSGHFIWITVRLVLVSIVFVLVMALFGAVGLARGATTILAAVAVGLAMAGPITAFTASSNNEQALTTMFRFGITPMFLFSGAFFPVSQLPGWLQPAAFVTPLWHAVEVARRFALNNPSALPLWQHFAYMALLFVVGALAAKRFLAAKMLP